MIPEHIGDAASRGDHDTIRAYFEDDSDGARDVDDGVPPSGSTLLMKCAWGDVRGRTILGHVEAARYLLSLGASVDLVNAKGNTALMLSVFFGGGRVADMVELLLSAGADPNVRNVSGISPLGKLLERSWSQDLGERIRIVSALLRAGASLDSCGRDGDNSFLAPPLGRDQGDIRAEHMLLRVERTYGLLRGNLPGDFVAVKSLIADVRRAGSWKSYCRLPHKQVLRLRSLLVRGRAQGTLRTEPRIRWLLKLPNDPLWHVLSYWRATE